MLTHKPIAGSDALRACTVVLLCSAALAAFPSAAAATLPTARYSFNSCQSNRRWVDPISLVFYKNGSVRGTNGVLDMISRYTGWVSDESKPQYFISGGNCSNRDGEMATGKGLVDRYHVRLSQLVTTSPASVGTPHREVVSDSSGCKGGFFSQFVSDGKHVVVRNGFARGRRVLVRALRNANAAASSASRGRTLAG